MTKRYTLGFSLGATLWLISAFVAAPWVYLLWGIAAFVDFSVPLGRSARELLGRYPPDVAHMAERYGLLTIIVLGESFVKVLTAVAEVGVTPQIAAMGTMALGITCFMWWLYFDDVAGSRVKPSMLHTIAWIYAHLPLTVSIVAVGVAIKKAIFFDPFEVTTAKYRWLLCGTLALALLSTALLDKVTERRQSEVQDHLRVNIRLGSALVVALLASIGGIPGSVFIAIVSAVCFLQVVIDLATSPLAADPHSVHHAGPAYASTMGREESAPEAQVQTSWRVPYRDVSDAVRKGTPSGLRRDLYFHFMEGSWLQLLGALVLFYLFSNLVFAGLYLLVDGSVTGVAKDDFVSAFAFSVQTMTTLGYGAMAPVSGWGHFLVTIEAAFGVLGVALATGLFFAKMARPRANVLWSEPIVVTQHEGKPTLMLRVGNARGNEVVEATMRLSVLCNVTTPEGHQFGRLYDLELMRETTPIFVLSWTVMHVIDETSPLWGVTADNVQDRIGAIIATMTAYDGTYAQTTHTRKTYAPQALAFGRRFVDVISTLPDGRRLVDYDVFHDTVPDRENAVSGGSEEEE